MSEKISQMQAFADELEVLMERDSRIVVMTADLVGSCALRKIETKWKERFINVGIAEQNMIGVAAGLAREGLFPYAYTFAAFNSMRACEQIRTDVFYNGLNVKVVGTHCGMSTGQAGSTHFALEDIGIMRSMPKSVILIPSDPVSARKTADLMFNYEGGAYIRLDRNPLEQIYGEDETFEMGKGHVLREGKDVVLYSVGAVTGEVRKAAEVIQEKTGLTVAVIDVYSVKPIDRELVNHYAKICSYGFTVEEHNVCGGLFGAVAECISQEEHSCILRPIGIKEHYPHGNVVERARELEGLDAEGIIRQVINTIS